MTSEVMEICVRRRIMRLVQSHAGTLVREWRTTRRLSQLELALEANVSSRHLSCVETGKAQPSRDMISRLADALEMPLRERNALLVAAGFAPRYRETELKSPEMAPVRRAIEFILQHQEPYPAIVTNRHWEMLLTNDATARIFNRLRPGGPKHRNVLHQIFDPQDMRSVIRNWEECAIDIIRHLHQHFPDCKVMLVSDYDDAQQQAEKAGAIKGFGKSEMGSPKLAEHVKQALD